MTELFSMDSILSGVEFLQQRYAESPILALGIFIFAYIGGTTLSLPVGNALSLMGGAVFGVTIAFPVSLLCTSIGASGGFLMARHLLGEWVTSRHGAKINNIRAQLQEQGSLYVVGLRMTMIVPYALINWAMGLSDMKIRKFFIATMIGQIPVVLIFVNAGKAVFNFKTVTEVVSLRIGVALTAAALIPLIIAYRKSRGGSRRNKRVRDKEILSL